VQRLTAHEKLCEGVYAARDAMWASLGKVDPYVLAHIINPTFMGGPRWPALRQAFRLVRRNRGLLVASDGLSDPSDEKKGSRTGFGLEVYAETRDKVGEPRASWLFQLVWQVSQLAAGRGGFDDLLDEMGIRSTEVRGVSAPAKLINEHGRVGVLLNVIDKTSVPERVKLPTGNVRLVNAKLLHLSELAFILDKGERGRKEIAKRLRAQGDALLSSVRRKPVA
jgi:hypothetical protein